MGGGQGCSPQHIYDSSSKILVKKVDDVIYAMDRRHILMKPPPPGRKDRWTDGQMDGHTDGQMDGWTDGRTINQPRTQETHPLPLRLAKAHK